MGQARPEFYHQGVKSSFPVPHHHLYILNSRCPHQKISGDCCWMKDLQQQHHHHVSGLLQHSHQNLPKKFKFDIQAKCLFRTLHWPPAYLNHGLVKAAAQLWQGRWRWRFFAAIFRHFPTHHHLLALLPSFSSCTAAWFIVEDGVHMVEHGPRANLNHSSFNSTHGTTLPDKNGKWHRKNAQTFRNKVKAWKWQGCKQEQSRCAGRDCIRYDGNYSELRRYQLPSHHPSKSLPSSKRPHYIKKKKSLVRDPAQSTVDSTV